MRLKGLLCKLQQSIRRKALMSLGHIVAKVKHVFVNLECVIQLLKGLCDWQGP